MLVFKDDAPQKITIDNEEYYAVPVKEVFILDQTQNENTIEKLARTISELDAERQIIKSKLAALQRELNNFVSWIEMGK